MRYPVVLLDAGETLIGPTEPFGAVYARIASGAGIAMPAEGFERALRRAAVELSGTIPAGADRFAWFGGEREYWRRFVDQALGDRAPDTLLDGLESWFREPAAWTIYPDVVPALRALREAGARLAVVSNWDSRLPVLLQQLGLAPYFEALVVSHLEGVEKPDPELFRRALERLGVEAGAALHVGDSHELDVAGARAAGIDALRIDRSGRDDPDAGTIVSLEALPPLVRRP